MQADISTTRTHGGTGIGLSISQHLVALMGGRLAFVSRPEVGTTFYFDMNVPYVKESSLANRSARLLGRAGSNIDLAELQVGCIPASVPTSASFLSSSV